MLNVEVDYSLLVQLLDADAACGYVLYRALGALIFWSFGPQYYTQIIVSGSIILGYLLILWNILVCVCVRCGSDIRLIATMPPCIWRFSRNSYTSTVVISILRIIIVAIHVHDMICALGGLMPGLENQECCLNLRSLGVNIFLLLASHY